MKDGSGRILMKEGYNKSMSGGVGLEGGVGFVSALGLGNQ